MSAADARAKRAPWWMIEITQKLFDTLIILGQQHCVLF
jgi:hypothetical protein